MREVQWMLNQKKKEDLFGGSFGIYPSRTVSGQKAQSQSYLTLYIFDLTLFQFNISSRWLYFPGSRILVELITILVWSRVSSDATISNYSSKTYWMQLTTAITAENWQPISFRGAVWNRCVAAHSSSDRCSADLKWRCRKG